MATTNGDRGRIPLVLIHGAWLSARSWEKFADYFDKRGFAVSAPEWPRKHGDVEELRADGDELAGLGLDEIVDHYEALIRGLDQPPPRQPRTGRVDGGSLRRSGSCGLRGGEVGDRRRAPPQPEERDRADRAAGPRELRLPRLDAVADDARPHRPGDGGPDHAHDAPPEGRLAGRRRAASRRTRLGRDLRSRHRSDRHRRRRHGRAGRPPRLRPNRLNLRSTGRVNRRRVMDQVPPPHP